MSSSGSGGAVLHVFPSNGPFFPRVEINSNKGGVGKGEEDGENKIEAPERNLAFDRRGDVGDSVPAGSNTFYYFCQCSF